MKQIQSLLFLIASILLFSCAHQVQEKSDPLPSWNEGKTKQAIVTGEGRVLVMDDEELVRRSLKMIISRLGYQVEVVSNGEEAVGAYTQALDSGTPLYSVIFA